MLCEIARYLDRYSTQALALSERHAWQVWGREQELLPDPPDAIGLDWEKLAHVPYVFFHDWYNLGAYAPEPYLWTQWTIEHGHVPAIKGQWRVNYVRFLVGVAQRQDIALFRRALGYLDAVPVEWIPWDVSEKSAKRMSDSPQAHCLLSALVICNQPTIVHYVLERVRQPRQRRLLPPKKEVMLQDVIEHYLGAQPDPAMIPSLCQLAPFTFWMDYDSGLASDIPCDADDVYVALLWACDPITRQDDFLMRAWDACPAFLTYCQREHGDTYWTQWTHNLSEWVRKSLKHIETFATCMLQWRHVFVLTPSHVHYLNHWWHRWEDEGEPRPVSPALERLKKEVGIE
jgi:hypothetical protein